MDTAVQTTPEPDVLNIPLEAITVQRDSRIRHQLDGIEHLAEQLRTVGLLQPIGLTPTWELVFGERRLEAARLLGWTEIPARILHDAIDEESRRVIEIRENRDRADFNLRDQLRAAKIMLPIVQEATKRHQQWAENDDAHPGRTSSLPTLVSDSDTTMYIQVNKGDKTRDVLARELNIGRHRLEQAMAIEEAASADPKVAEIFEQMLDDQNVSSAWNKFQKHVKPPADPPKPETDNKPAADTATTDEPSGDSDAPDTETVPQGGALAGSDKAATDRKPAPSGKSSNKKSAKRNTAATNTPDEAYDPDAWTAALTAAVDQLLLNIPPAYRQKAKEHAPAILAGKLDALPGGPPAATATARHQTADELVELLNQLPPDEQHKAAQHFRDLYADPVPERPDQAARYVAHMIDSAPKGNRAKMIAAIANQLPSGSPNPAHYLPKLPDRHADACEQLRKEITTRVTELKGFEDWDQNGRRKAARDLVSHLHKKATEVKHLAAIEQMQDTQQTLVDVQWPEHLDTPDIKAAWEKWLKNRKARKLSVDAALVQKKQIAALAILDHEQALEVISSAIERNWQGIRLDVCQKPWCGRAPAGPDPKLAAESKKTAAERAVEEQKKAREKELRAAATKEMNRLQPELSRDAKKAATQELAGSIGKQYATRIAKSVGLTPELTAQLEKKLQCFGMTQFIDGRIEQNSAES